MGLFDFLKTKKTNSAPKYSVPGTRKADYSTPYRFRAMTWGQYERALTSVCTRTPGFKLSDDDFVQKYKSDRKVYQFKFKDALAELVPEPTNEYDPNAIKVMLDGQHVGYVPRDETAAVRARIQRPHEMAVRVYGGPWKRNRDGLVDVGASDFTVNVEIRDTPQAVGAVCPACGAPASGKFCSRCGAKL